MPWNLDSDRPIFIQIIERIQMILFLDSINQEISCLLYENSRRKHL